MARFEFTDEQRRAIETVDRSVLVSAAAGSGKTAVLAARCAYLVCDAPPPFRCDVDQLLVVTFTEAAAAEMKERIGRALRERCARSPEDRRLRAQVALVDTAQISTLHAFCLWMVRRWFDRAGVDATAQMLGGDEARLLRQDALAQVFDGWYAGDGELAARFRTLVDDYGLGYDGTIGEFVLRLSAFAVSQDDPDAWLSRARDTSPQRLAEVLRETGAALRVELDRQVEHCHEGARVIARCFPTAAFYGDLLAGHAEQLATWAARLADGAPWETVRAEIGAYKLSSKGAPSVARDAPEELRAERDNARALFKDAREGLLQKRLQAQLCRFSATEIAADFERTAPYRETIVDLTQAFLDHYAEKKRSLSVMDFADLERFAFDLLTRPGEGEQDSAVAETLRRRFAHVLVDEYQDINPLQARILNAVSRESSADVGGNLFTVGDVKQSIYRFRLAEPEMFVRRAAALRAGAGGECVDLQRNYRSRCRILSAANEVFGAVMRADCGGIAYDERAALKPAGDAVPLGEAVELHVVERTVDEIFDEDDEARLVDTTDPAQWGGVEREGYLIARRIAELIDAGTQVDDGAGRRLLRYGDICVLLRSTRHSAAPLANMLRQLGIPTWTEAGSGLLDSREVRDVLALLAVLDNVQQDIPLAAVLRSGILGDAFAEDELVALRTHDRYAEFHEAVRGYAERGGDGPLRDRCARTLRRIAGYRRAMREEPLADVLWAIYRETGFFAHVGGLRGGEQRRANLIALHERARQFGGFHRQGLRRFLRFIDSLQAEGEDLAAPVGLTEADNVVRIMSIHKAKGLEFPVVIAAELGRRFNLADASGRFLYERHVGVGVKAIDRDRLLEYPTALHRWCARAATEASLAEELRVWYVAMTRAREKLILVGTEEQATLERLRLTADAAGERIGPLRILGARSPLHWLIAAQGAMPAGAVIWDTASAAHDDTVFTCRWYDAEAVRGWRLPKAEPSTTRALRQALTTLAPLPQAEPVSAESAAAARVVGRLDFVYPQLAVTSVPVARAASGFERRAGDGAEEAPRVDVVARSVERSASRAEAVRRGHAVHTALEFIEPASAGNPAAITKELERLVADGTLSADDAVLVAVGDLAWFFDTPLGRKVRAAGAAYRREWMFLATEPIETFDATVPGDESDRVLVRGVVDGVLLTADALEIVDYKTDRVAGDAVAQRAAGYDMQMRLYASAVERVFGRPVDRTHLVFLHSRQVVSAPGSGK